METEVQAVATQAAPHAGTHTPGERATASNTTGRATTVATQSSPTTARRRAGNAVLAALKPMPLQLQVMAIPMETEVQATAMQAASHARTHTPGERVTVSSMTGRATTVATQSLPITARRRAANARSRKIERSRAPIQIKLCLAACW